MDKEPVSERVRHCCTVVKDFTVRQYHSFADFLAKKKNESRKNGCCTILGMNFTKYVFIVMNLFYLLMGLFMILMGSSSYYALDTFYNLLWIDVQGLSIVWIISGGLLASISIFGIIGAFKESIAWANIYGVLLCITFFLQILTSIAAYCLVATGSSNYHASNLIDHLMRNYYVDTTSANKMDYIQRNFQCCGGDDPSDWDNNRDEYYFDYDTLSREIGASTTVGPSRTPASCCSLNEMNRYQDRYQDRYQYGYTQSYQDNYPTTKGDENKACTDYYKKGCTMAVTDLVSETVLIVASVLLAIGVLQILGMVTSFMLARMFRKVSTYRNIQKFSSQYERVFDVPSHVDYQRLHNSNDALDDVNVNHN